MHARPGNCTTARLHDCTAARLHGCTVARLRERDISRRTEDLDTEPEPLQSIGDQTQMRDAARSAANLPLIPLGLALDHQLMSVFRIKKRLLQ